MATGAMANLKWGLESTFGSTASTIDQPFGYAVECTALDMDNNSIARRGLGSRNLQIVGFGMFSGTMSLRFDLANPFIFRLITGGYGSTGTGPYTYTFPEAVTLPSFSIQGYIKNIDGLDDTLRTFVGCVVTDATLDAAVGTEPIAITLNIAFSGVYEDDAVEEAVYPTADLLIFAHAVWKKESTVIAKTENVSLRINQNTELKPYLGSRWAQRAKFGDREYEITSLHYYGSTAMAGYVADFYGTTPTTGPINTGPVPRAYTLEITAYATQDAPSYTFAFDNGWITKHGQPLRVNEDIMDDVTILAKSMSLTVTNEEDIEPEGWST